MLLNCNYEATYLFYFKHHKKGFFYFLQVRDLPDEEHEAHGRQGGLQGEPQPQEVHQGEDDGRPQDLQLSGGNIINCENGFTILY